MITIEDTKGGVIMRKDGKFLCCDSPLAREYYRQVLSGFHGRVLVAGLGLGVALDILCSLPAVESVDCVEIDEEVYTRRWPTSKKANVHLADIWDFEPEGHHCAFFDIWSDYYTGKEEAQKLEARGLAKIQVSLPLTYEKVVA